MFSLSFNLGLPTPNLGSVYVRLDKGEYSPGEQVSGTIMLDLYTPFQFGNQIWLTLAGVEQARLVEHKQRQDGEEKIEEKIEHAEQNVFFNHKIPVYSFSSGMISPGQYSFPFGFVLQSGLPSSFQHKFKMGLEDCFAGVTYELQASLSSSQSSPPAISHTIPFNVNQPVSLSNEGSRKEMNSKIDSCCCISRGESRIVSYFEKVEYVPGETAYLICEADNSKCTVKLNNISASFNQHIKITARGYSHQITQVLTSMVMDGIGPGERKVGPDSLRMAVQLMSGDKNNQKGVQPTCRGKLINNEYYLVNTLNVDACICCGSHPSSSLRLNVRNPDLQYIAWSAQPAQWSPQVMPTATIQFDSEFRLPTNDFMGPPGDINFNNNAMPVMPPPPS